MNSGQLIQQQMLRGIYEETALREFSLYAVAPRPGHRTDDLVIKSPTPYRCATTPTQGTIYSQVHGSEVTSSGCI